MREAVAWILSCNCLIACHLADSDRNFQKQVDGVLVGEGFLREEICLGRTYGEDHCWLVENVEDLSLVTSQLAGFDSLKLDKDLVGFQVSLFQL